MFLGAFDRLCSGKSFRIPYLSSLSCHKLEYCTYCDVSSAGYCNLWLDFCSTPISKYWESNAVFFIITGAHILSYLIDIPKYIVISYIFPLFDSKNNNSENFLSNILFSTDTDWGQWLKNVWFIRENSTRIYLKIIEIICKVSVHIFIEY